MFRKWRAGSGGDDGERGGEGMVTGGWVEGRGGSGRGDESEKSMLAVASLGMDSSASPFPARRRHCAECVRGCFGRALVVAGLFGAGVSAVCLRSLSTSLERQA